MIEVLHVFETHADARKNFEKFIEKNKWLVEKKVPNNMVLYLENGTRVTYAKVTSLDDTVQFEGRVFAEITGLVEGTDWAEELKCRIRI